MLRAVLRQDAALAERSLRHYVTLLPRCRQAHDATRHATGWCCAAASHAQQYATQICLRYARRYMRCCVRRRMIRGASRVAGVMMF